MDNRLTDISDISGLIPAEGCGNLYRELFGSMYDGVCIFEKCGSKFRAIYLNERMFEIAGYTRDQFRPYLNNISVFLFEDDERRLFGLVDGCMESGKAFSCEVRGVRYDRSVAWYSMRVSPAAFIKSDNPAFFCTINDISRLKNAQHELNISYARCKMLEEMTDALMFEYSNVTDTMRFLPGKNRSERVIEGYTSYLRRSDRILEEDVVYYVDALFRACRKVIRSEIDVRSLNAEKTDYELCRVSYSSIADDYGTILNVVGCINVIGRVSDMEAKPDTVREKEGFGCLPDSFSCIKKIKSIISGASERCCMALLDIDRFGEFNKKYGQETSDAALEKIASFIREIFGEDTAAFRYNGEDEFVIFIEGASDSGIYDMAEDLREKCLNTDFSGRGDGVGLTLSIGAGWSDPSKRLNIKDFYVTAGRALFMAKLEGKDRMYLKKIIF